MARRRAHGAHHKNIKASVARMNAEKAAAHTAAEMAQSLEATMKSAFDRKVREAEELEAASLRLMNQIEQLESQSSVLLDERNGAMADTHKVEAALSACELERDAAKEWHESTLRANAEKAPSIVQDTAATTVNLGPDTSMKPWRPAPHERKFFGKSRVFPDPVSSSSGSSSSAAPTPSPSSASPATAPTPSPATDVELHHRAVMANPLGHGGSEVERQREIEKDYKMLVAARNKGLFPEDKNACSGIVGKRSGTVQGSSAMPEEFLATTAVPAWRQQLQLDTDASNQMVGSSGQWPPREWGEERRAATARVGPDGEPDP